MLVAWPQTHREVAMNEVQMLDSQKPTTKKWLQLIKAEYLEIPGLCLTPPVRARRPGLMFTGG